MFKKCLLSAIVILTFSGCTTTVSMTHTASNAKNTLAPNAAQMAAAAKLEMGEAELTKLLNKPLYQMPPEETGRYIS